MLGQSNEFGRFFRNRRTALGLSLSEFCRQNGFDKANISRLERGLVKPPVSSELLQNYADALRMSTESEDRKSFMRHAAIARGKLPSIVPSQRAGDIEVILRKMGRRLHDPWVKAWHLEQWSSSREAQAVLPRLVRQLVSASTEHPTRIEIPCGEGVQRHGWDGIVDAPKESLFVPAGISVWEISVEQKPASKASRDFDKRKAVSLGVPPSEVTFVFVTSRKWDGKQKWREEKRKLGRWKSVEVYDSMDLEAWLETAPGVDAWIAEQLGRRPAGVISISDHWECLSRLSHPRLKPEVFLASRRKTAEQLREFLLGPPGVMAFQCRSPIEAVDFVAAYLALTSEDDVEIALDEDDRMRTQGRTVIVRDRSQWDGLSQASGHLVLLPMPSLSLTPEEQNAALSRGHRIIVAATQFSSHRLQAVTLPRPSRYDLEHALRNSEFGSERASKASRAAGGSLSVLKRHLSEVPTAQLPDWCSDARLSGFLPMLLIGAWDDANEIDRDVLSRLSNRPYAEVQDLANRLSLAEEAPLTRIESRWRLVSPEDSWILVGSHVTDHLLSSFETIAIEILSQQDDSLTLSADERLAASIRGTLPVRASELLRGGISETAAILGSEFGPVADLPGTQQRANRIVGTTLHGGNWLRWATLRKELPLLAEAAPDEFLGAIGADLKKKRPELATLLADDEDDHPLTSRCKHAGLLWALESLAWSADLLPKVCTLLAKLAEVDTGRTWGNRPATSLRDILLAWHPQTAAGVEKRIAILKSLADRTPAVAWELLFAMLPDVLTTADLTHRPVWRDWTSGWRKGTSGADYWKQVDVAAELISQLVGNDMGRWCKVLDKLHFVPEAHRNELIDRLRNLPVTEIIAEERRQLAEYVRKTIHRHRDFADANWALPADTVDALEEALHVLLPETLCERHAWLFVPWPKIEDYRNRYKEMNVEIRRRRADALREIVGQDGLDGALKLADVVESPGQVGATLAEAGCLPDEQLLPNLLRSANANHQSLAANFARLRIARAGWDWVRELSLNEWDARDAALLLSQAGLVPEAWNLAESLGRDISREYWNIVPAYGGSHLDQPHLEFACRRLLDANRPECTIRVLSDVAYDRATVLPTVVVDALTACLKWKNTNPDTGLSDDTLHTIQELFGWLQGSIPFNDDKATRRLGQLEWNFLSLLDGFGAAPETLIHCLSDDPQFFAQLIALVFRSKSEQESDSEASEEQQRMASHGYRLLMKWNHVPGSQADGSIDEEHLMQWLESARSLCRESGHLEVANSKIGEMLASWPKPEDESEMWPCEAICDAIEEVASDELDHGFQVGILNSRGATMRSPLDGGDLERREAAKYRSWAELCDVEWPRTAAALHRVADSYEHQAQREDVRATEFAQERH